MVIHKLSRGWLYAGVVLTGIALAESSGCRSDGYTEPIAAQSRIDGIGGEFLEYDTGIFKMDIPKGVTIEESQQADFFRYEFYLGEEPSELFMVAYDAAFPPFPAQAPETAPVDIANTGKVEKRSILWKPESDAGLQSREVLVTYQKSKDVPPERLHLMYSDLMEHEARIADRIMKSVRYHRD